MFACARVCVCILAQTMINILGLNIIFFQGVHIVIENGPGIPGSYQRQVVCTLPNANTFEKGMNTTILPTAMGK